MKPAGGVIQDIDPAGLGAQIGLKPGDRIIEINGHEICDVLDYGFFIRDARVELQVQEKATGVTRWFEIEKDEDDDLGLTFTDATFDGLRRCRNRCLFCFVDQMPRGMRTSLYEKDDDYRYSFWHGNFITLTNLKEPEFNRLLTLRLSPLYISVQATEPEVRRRLLRHREAGEIMNRLRRLAQGRIQLHTQIVCCPGINDGLVLNQTLSDLWSLGQALASVAVVPVGLTQYRDGLFPLRPFEPQGAERVIQMVESWQQKARAERDESIFFAADEFYLSAGHPIPEASRYDDYPQLENGVGLCRLFTDEWNDYLRERFSFFQSQFQVAVDDQRIYVVTGVSGHRFLDRLMEDAQKQYGIDWYSKGLRLVGVTNEVFGCTVTVAGLLTGRDVINALKLLDDPPEGADVVLIPSVMLRAEGDMTLDNMTPEEMSAALGGIPVRVVDTQGDALLAALEGR